MAPIKITSSRELNQAISYYLQPSTRHHIRNNSILEAWKAAGFEQVVHALEVYNTRAPDIGVEEQYRIDLIRSAIGGTVVKTPSLLTGKTTKNGYISFNNRGTKGEPEIDSAEILCALFPDLFTHYELSLSQSSISLRFHYVKKVAKDELSEWYGKNFSTLAKKEELLQPLMLALAGRSEMVMAQIYYNGPVGMQPAPIYSKNSTFHITDDKLGSLEDHLANLRAMSLWRSRIETACGSALKELASRKGLPKLIEYLRSEGKLMTLIGCENKKVAEFARVALG